jgi:DNA-binding transcriptional ArsR family regulator
MDAGLDIATVDALVADPCPARIPLSLRDGRARTAKELALEAQVTRQTAGSHLAPLVGARLLGVHAQGRHQYIRLAATRWAAGSRP